MASMLFSPQKIDQAKRLIERRETASRKLHKTAKIKDPQFIT